jgi:16S rRNA (adenine1518-N6/adenine1519-N6)-dimethyltransferase
MHRLAPSSRSKTASTSATSGVPAALRALGIRPSRRLGQNFLIDPRVAERIASLVEDPREPVVEVGPGLGALSLLFARTGRPLTVVELDLRLAEYMEHALAPYPSARVIRGDILEHDLDALLIGGPAEGPATVAGNLPYAITTPAVEWILRQGPRLSRSVLMVQREYAERLLARAGTKEYGSISIFVSLHAEVVSLFRVSAGAFYPRPEVDSIVLELMPRAYPGTTGEERDQAARLARAGTGTRRKTVANALARGLDGIDVAAVRKVLSDAGVDAERRGETLSVEEWIGVARAWLRREDSIQPR